MIKTELGKVRRMIKRAKAADLILDKNSAAAQVALFYKIKRRSERNYIQFTNPEGKIWRVYPFDFGGPTCSCPDFRYRRNLKPEGCKHILAVKALYSLN